MGGENMGVVIVVAVIVVAVVAIGAVLLKRH